jgi:anaerobic magnesium-protoporphyrin IX monomethyl ester cyclase
MNQFTPYRDQNDLIMQGLLVSEVVERVPETTKIIGFSCLFSHCYPLVKEMMLKIKKKLCGNRLVTGFQTCC